MGKWQGRYEINTVGRTFKDTATGSSQSKQLVTKPSATAMKRFLVHASGSGIHLRQGDSTVTATTSDLPLASGAYRVITVDSAENSYLAYLNDGTSATLWVQELTNPIPGEATSGANGAPFDG